MDGTRERGFKPFLPFPILLEKENIMKIEIEKIRSTLSMHTVLDRYGITDLRQTGSSLSGCCPIHRGDNPNAFHVSLEKNLWNCFTQHHGGDPLSFIMEYEDVSFREAAGIAMEVVSSSIPIRGKPPPHRCVDKGRKNPPLRFTLPLISEHSYLTRRRIERSTVRHFGIGYCNKGILDRRIAIPVHDENGRLVAYCGRSVTSQKPKYRFPKGFKKSLTVFNLHRAKTQNTSQLILVEGFFDAFRIHQAGLPNVVALMGSSISNIQIDLIQSLHKNLVVLLDGDVAGRKGTKKIINAFRGKLPVTAKYLSNGIQPDDLKENELQKLLQERNN